MAAIAQTIAIVDKSGKVVSTSKQLKNVFKEAKVAYLGKRAEIAAERKAKEDRELRKAIKAMSVADDESNVSRSRSRHHHSRSRGIDDEHRPSLGGRHHSGASVRSGYSNRSSLSESPRSRDEPPSYSGHHTPLAQFNDELNNSRSAPRQSDELVRRRTDLDLAQVPRRKPVRSQSAAELDHAVDMDLAYGEYHPDSLALSPRVEETLQKQELSSLVTKCKMLLDEANCAQHSVKAIVAHLQKNPDAMAAVALTLAEISNIVTKMGPGALAAFKTGAPAVFAILAAPEFLIAVGVGVGITVVMFGGYKIIKKIKARKSGDKEGAGMDEMLDVTELDRIEHWRRGIADSDTMSVATSVEGEFITPMAAASMGHLPQSRKSKSEEKEKKKQDKKDKKHHSTRRGGDELSELGSERSNGSRPSRSGSGKLKVPGSELKGGKERAVVKVKKPSPLRRMFTSRETSSTVS